MFSILERETEICIYLFIFSRKLSDNIAVFGLFFSLFTAIFSSVFWKEEYLYGLLLLFTH